MSATPSPLPAIAERLLAWYQDSARNLPWRAPPGAPPPEPYPVWLSEVMLQQTTVAAVKPYHAKFLAQWPDIHALARVSEAEVMAAWAGLGYYSRARNLYSCAQTVAHELGGAFPSSAAALKKLPGIGDYTAAAIAAICFDEPVAVVDANVERVIARLMALDTPLPAARKAIRAHVQALTPQNRAGDFAQAMMDLGATLCTARTADCAACPLSGSCQAARGHDPLAFPVKPKKRNKPTRKGHCWWIERDGHVWLVRRPAKGMLGGMRALPSDDWRAGADGHGTPPITADWQSCAPVRHSFTHFHLVLDVSAARLSAGDNAPQGEGEWLPTTRLDEAGLPSLYAKAAASALALKG